jgi:hypothetical protein
MSDLAILRQEIRIPIPVIYPEMGNSEVNVSLLCVEKREHVFLHKTQVIWIILNVLA